MTSLKYKLDTLVLEQYKWPVLEIKGFFSHSYSGEGYMVLHNAVVI